MQVVYQVSNASVISAEEVLAETQTALVIQKLFQSLFTILAGIPVTFHVNCVCRRKCCFYNKAFGVWHYALHWKKAFVFVFKASLTWETEILKVLVEEQPC